MKVSRATPFAIIASAFLGGCPAASPPTPSISDAPTKLATWMAVDLLAIGDTNADATPFDTRKPSSAGYTSAGVQSMWRDTDDRGRPHPRWFTVTGSWTPGQAPGSTTTRMFEIQAQGQPTFDRPYSLHAGEPTKDAMRIVYAEVFRIGRNTWTSQSGTVVFKDSGRQHASVEVKASLLPASLVPEYGSVAKGRLDVVGAAFCDFPTEQE